MGLWTECLCDRMKIMPDNLLNYPALFKLQYYQSYKRLRTVALRKY